MAVLVGLACVLCSTVETSAQQRKIPFDRMTVEDGLPHSAVNAIAQDETGFIWLGTQDGLARYDGNRFEVLKSDEDNLASISNNWIWTLLTDRAGRLWVGTNEGGLNLWEPQTKSFRRYMNLEMDSTSISNNRVRSLMEDKDGRIWVGTESGINVLDAQSQTFSRYLHDPSKAGSLAHNQVRAIFEDSNGLIWIGTNGGGLDQFDPETGSFRHHRPTSSGRVPHTGLQLFFHYITHRQNWGRR